MSSSSKKKPIPAPIRKTVNAAPLPPVPPPAVVAEPPKRERKISVMKPPIDRALKLTRLLDAKAIAALTLVSRWHGEATSDQQKLNADLVATLKQVAPLAERAMIATDQLARSGFNPIGGRGIVRGPLTAGSRVVLKEKRFTAAFGAMNDFEVVLESEGMVRLREIDNPRAPQFVVARSWLLLVNSGDDAPDGNDGDSMLAPDTDPDGTE
jgi:hypothetical protein